MQTILSYLYLVHIVRTFFGLLYKLYVSLLFLCLALILQPLLLLLLRKESLHPYAHSVFVFWSYTFCILSGWIVRVKGKEHLQHDEPLIIVANHSSFLDIFLLPMIFRNKKHVFLGKAEILRYPIIRHYFHNYHIPVYRGSGIKAGKSIIHAGKKIKNGWSIVIFPEGGISDDKKPQLTPFKNGAFQLAKSLNCAILPITFRNNYKHLDEPITLHSGASPGVIRITIHKPIEREKVAEQSLTALKNHCYTEIHQELMGFPAEK